jgi:hypothetical protein
MNEPPPKPPQPPMPPYGGPGMSPHRDMSPKQPLPKSIKYIYWGGAFTALLGIAILAISTWVYTFSGESANWQNTEGQFVSSRIRTKVSRSGRVSRAGRNTGHGIRYYVEPLYRYRVNRTFHQGTRFALARTAPDFRDREEAIAYQQQNFPRGKAVTVYYNPDDHSDAVLETTRVEYGWMFFAMGACFLLMAGLVLGIGKHESKRAAMAHGSQFTGAV